MNNFPAALSPRAMFCSYCTENTDLVFVVSFFTLAVSSYRTGNGGLFRVLATEEVAVSPEQWSTFFFWRGGGHPVSIFKIKSQFLATKPKER